VLAMTAVTAPSVRTKELLGKLADGIDKLTESDEWQRYLDVQSRFHRYSFGNCLLILAQRPDTGRVASFKKRQERGWCVKPGDDPDPGQAPCVEPHQQDIEGMRSLPCARRSDPASDRPQVGRHLHHGGRPELHRRPGAPGPSQISPLGNFWNGDSTPQSWIEPLAAAGATVTCPAARRLPGA
jgi:hypothetical protein